MSFVPPNDQDIAEIFKHALDEDVVSAKRFTTGFAHYVYDVKTKSDNFVLRVANPDMTGDNDGIQAFQKALYWNEKLKPMGIPLPKIYYEDIDAKNFPFHHYIMERLEGADLQDVYHDMTAGDLENLAEKISVIQNKVAALSFDNGFGWILAKAPGSNEFEKMRGLIGRVGIFPMSVVDELEKNMLTHRAYFDNIRPVPFLDDIQGKNVIINSRHELSGIVDVDVVAYGDRLSVIGLTRMALWTKNDPAGYIGALLRGMKIENSADKKEALRLYTMYYCVDFMSEIGREFNKNKAEIDPMRVDKLNQIFGLLADRQSL